MLIVEHFFLIACSPQAGRPTWPRRTPDAETLAAAALLLDLAVQGRLRLVDAKLHADTRVPLTHPLLARALHTLDAHPVPTSAAIPLVARRLHPLPEHVLDGLFRRDLVHRDEERSWLFRKRVLYPLRSVQARNEAVQSLRHAIGDEHDLHGFAVLLLAEISGMLPLLLQAREHEAAEAHLLALNK